MAAISPFRGLTLPYTGWNTVKNACQKIATNSLMQRATTHGGEFLMLSGVVMAVISATTAFFYGSPFLAISFFVLGSLTALSAFYMHQFQLLQGLEQTTSALSQERDHFRKISDALTHENITLHQTNLSLIETNTAFQQTTEQLRSATATLVHNNSVLKDTNTALDKNCSELRQSNIHLTRHVTQLTLQISQLQESAERIRDEILLFRHGNQQFGGNLKRLDTSVRTLEDQICSSRQLHDEISTQLHAHNLGIKEQVEQLQKYFHELSNQNAIMARIQELTALQSRIDANKEQLHTINTEFAQGRARLLEIQDILQRLRDSFATVLQEMHSANQDHQSENELLRSQVAKITQLLSRIPVTATA